MRRNWIALAVAVMALVPAAALAHGGPEVGVQGDIHAGGGIDVTGEDFPEGELVTISLLKDGGESLVLGTVTAGEDEAFEAVFHVPDDLRPGLYQLGAVSGDESASAQVTVLEAADGSLPSSPPAALAVSNDRPTTEAMTLAVVTAGIAALGVLLLWLGRTRPRHAGA
jgi:hypothetical protein